MGIEPATRILRICCSTTELHRLTTIYFAECLLNVQIITLTHTACQALFYGVPSLTTSLIAMHMPCSSNTILCIAQNANIQSRQSLYSMVR